jgi:hypothetical protein
MARINLDHVDRSAACAPDLDFTPAVPAEESRVVHSLVQRLVAEREEENGRVENERALVFLAVNAEPEFVGGFATRNPCHIRRIKAPVMPPHASSSLSSIGGKLRGRAWLLLRIFRGENFASIAILCSGKISQEDPLQ